MSRMVSSFSGSGGDERKNIPALLAGMVFRNGSPRLPGFAQRDGNRLPARVNVFETPRLQRFAALMGFIRAIICYRRKVPRCRKIGLGLLPIQ